MKTNVQMTENEFVYASSIKRCMNDLWAIQDEINNAKSVAAQGISRGALQNVERDLYNLKASLINALKTVGI